jgi:hypothetical protein
MFPIRDTRGRTIAFGGRVLDAGEPKYLNSPETELFHKGRELYGLFEARQATRSLQRLLVVEGYMDVVSLHQAGVTYAVATLGTATTPEHLQRIFRLVGEVVFCFDGDRAGRAAAWRALENAVGEVKQGRQVRFLFLPEAQDPDTMVQAEGADAFESRLASALPLSDYLIRELSSRTDVASVDGRAKLVELARSSAGSHPMSTGNCWSGSWRAWSGCRRSGSANCWKAAPRPPDRRGSNRGPWPRDRSGRARAHPPDAATSSGRRSACWCITPRPPPASARWKAWRPLTGQASRC